MKSILVNKNEDNSKHLFLDDLPKFAQKFSESLRENDVVSLTGQIGAGKTTFVFSLMQQLGLSRRQAFSSPTFTILNRYQVDKWLINHIDLYRLNDFEEFENLDIIELFDEPKTITFIEWGDKFQELQAYYTKHIHFEYIEKKSLERMLTFDGF